MRVLFVTHNFPRFRGDLPGSFLLRLATALRDLAIDVRVVAPHSPGHPVTGDVDGIRVTRYRYAPDARETLAYSGTLAAQVRASWTSKFDLVRMLRAGTSAIRAQSREADVVHAHWWFPGGASATRFALRGTPLVTTLHGSDVRFARGAFIRSQMRRVLRRSRRVTAVSEWLAGEAATAMGGERPLVAPMPVAVDLFQPRDAPRDGLLFVGKLDAQKGTAVLLEALRLLPATLHATIVGDGPDARYLHARAADLGVAGRVRWVGAVAQEALPQYYRSARVLVAPATEPEGLGLVAAESLLCETPVIASDVGGARDIVIDGTTGKLVPPRDPSALAATISSALASRETLDAWGKEGRTRVLARFSPESCAATYHEVYQEALRAQRP